MLFESQMGSGNSSRKFALFNAKYFNKFKCSPPFDKCSSRDVTTLAQQLARAVEMLNSSPRSEGVTGVVTCAPTERIADSSKDTDAALPTPGKQSNDTRHDVDVYSYTRTRAERRNHTSQDVDAASLTPTERCTESDTPQAVHATRGLRITSCLPTERSIDVICRPRDDHTFADDAISESTAGPSQATETTVSTKQPPKRKLWLAFSPENQTEPKKPKKEDELQRSCNECLVSGK